MSRELVFDGFWEGAAEYSCDCCGKTVKFRFDSEESANNADNFYAAWPFISGLLEQAPEYGNLAEFNIFCITEIWKRNHIGYDRKFLKSSDLNLKERRDARIIEMCQRLNCDTYYSGSGAKDYHIEADYEAAGIKLVYSDYEPFRYPQQKPRRSRGSGEHRRDFVPNMSIIDYMMNYSLYLPWGVRL